MPDNNTGVDQRGRRLTLAACCFSVFMVTLDSTIVNVGLPTIQRQLGSSLSGLQWVVDAYVLVLAVLLMSSGAAGDRLGRRRVFQTGLVIFTVGSLLCSLAPTLTTLVAFRAFQAVGASMLLPTTLSIIANTYTDPRERAGAIGIWAGISGLSIAAGPVLGGLLVDSLGWESIFWVNIPIGIVAFAMAGRYIRESRAPRSRRFDARGQMLSIAFLALLTYALIEGPTHGWGSGLIVGLFIVSAGALAGFVVTERHSTEPLLDLAFFRNPSFAGAAAIAMLAFVALYGFIFFNSLYLQQVRGFSAIQAGLATLPTTGLIMFVSPFSGRLTGRRGPRIPVTLAGFAMLFGLVVLFQTTPTVDLVIPLVGYVLVGLAIGLINPPVTNAAVAGMPREQAGVASAVTGASRQVGAVLGVALVGSVVRTHFAAALPAKLKGLHLSPAIQSHLLAANHGGSPTVPTGPHNGMTTLIAQAVGTAFTEAIHWGYAVAAAAAALIIVIGLATMGHRRNSERNAGMAADTMTSADVRAIDTATR